MVAELNSFTPLPTDIDGYVVARDGDAWGAYASGFISPAESDVAWAATPEEALRRLRHETRAKAGPADVETLRPKRAFQT